MNWQEIIRENRRIIIIIGIITSILVVTLIVLICVKNALDAANESPVYVQTEQAPASISDLDVNSYTKELHSIIEKQYGTKLDGYNITTGELLEDGSWYITTIQKPLKNQWSLAEDVYRIILHKTSSEWQIVAEPSLVFTYADYPDIPRSVIFSANNF